MVYPDQTWTWTWMYIVLAGMRMGQYMVYLNHTQTWTHNVFSVQDLDPYLIIEADAECF